MKICVTGHRPNKLYGYDLSNVNWHKLKQEFKRILLAEGCSEAITGMALGVGSKSGAANCVKYAEKKGKEVIRIEP